MEGPLIVVYEYWRQPSSIIISMLSGPVCSSKKERSLAQHGDLTCVLCVCDLPLLLYGKHSCKARWRWPGQHMRVLSLIMMLPSMHLG